MKAAIFDFDGTLYESSQYWLEIINDYLLVNGQNPPQDILGIVKPLGITGGARFFKEKFNLQDKVEDIVLGWRNKMGEHYAERIPIRPFAVEYINRLKHENVRVCMATAMERKFVESALARTNAKALFEFILTIGDVKSDKSSPVLFLECARRLEAAPSECTIFEDSALSLQVGKAAGFKVVGVFDGVCFSEIDALKQAGDKFIMSFEEML